MPPSIRKNICHPAFVPAAPGYPIFCPHVSVNRHIECGHHNIMWRPCCTVGDDDIYTADWPTNMIKNISMQKVESKTQRKQCIFERMHIIEFKRNNRPPKKIESMKSKPWKAGIQDPEENSIFERIWIMKRIREKWALKSWNPGSGAKFNFWKDLHNELNKGNTILILYMYIRTCRFTSNSF